LPEFTLEEEAPEEVVAHATEEPKSSFEEISSELPLNTPPEPEPVAVPEITASDPAFDNQDFELVLEPQDEAPATSEVAPPVQAQHQGAPASAPANGEVFSSDAFLADLAKEIGELGLGELTPTPSQAETVSQPAAELVQAKELPGESGPLKEVFEEFRAELGEMGVEDEDLETHYNLGIAFREMGLLEEAIGEFQKVAKANDRGKAFRYAMQCCTLLGLAFMEKSQPAIAAIWYDRALLTPGIDTETKLALRYDLGVAQESAGDLDAALKSFSQVYAVNIDYRDVAERISSLQKPAR
jgi:tetratricopeptide (TPR) repeat protein